MDRKLFVQACREGGSRVEAALASLHRDYGADLLREGLLSLGDMEAARDLMHETLIRACRSCEGLREGSDLLPWLRHILRRTVVERLRKHGQAEPEGQVLPDRYASLHAPDQLLQDARLEASWRSCAAHFTQEQPLAATVMRWVAADDLSAEQIGELLQCSPSATSDFIAQCRRKIRFYFADWYALMRPQSSSPS